FSDSLMCRPFVAPADPKTRSELFAQRFVSEPGAWINSSTNQVREYGWRQSADVSGAFGRPQCFPGKPTNVRILSRPSSPVGDLTLQAGVRVRSTVKLMERGLAHKNDQFCIRQLQSATECVEIDKPSTWCIETLVKAAKQIPHFSLHKQGIGLRNGLKPSVAR